MSDEALVIATIALVIVTSLYSYFTYKLVKETRKDRRIRWIENRLSRFYYPLKNDPTFFQSGILPQWLSNRLYLASVELRRMFDYLDELDVEDAEAHRAVHPEQREKLMKEISLTVMKENYDLKVELDKLTES
jgi:hypothetical protein